MTLYLMASGKQMRLMRQKRMDNYLDQVKIRDVNGRDENGELTNQPDGQLNNDDRAIIGSTVPKWSGGITNGLPLKASISPC